MAKIAATSWFLISLPQALYLIPISTPGIDKNGQLGYTIAQKDGITNMPTVKTAISLRQSLFDQVDALAREMQTSRSRLFVLAMEEFIERYQNQRLLQEINAAYGDMPEPAEQDLLRSMRRQHRQLVEGQW